MEVFALIVFSQNKNSATYVNITRLVMSHTKRIYNNPKLKKVQRYNVDDGLPHVIVGIPYTFRSWICMGHCHSCRDQTKDQKRLRKQRKEQFRFDLKKEVLMNENILIEEDTPIIPVANSFLEIEQILKNSVKKDEKMIFNNHSVFFSKKPYLNSEYWIQRRENELYGWVLFDNTWILSYPHLTNIKDTTNLSIESSILELKENGTNICIGRYKNNITGIDFDVIRTRTSPFPEEFPIPTFWNETINSMKNKQLSEKLLQLRTEMLSKYPKWFINSGDGEYIGLRVQEVVHNIIDVNKTVSFNHNYNFYFELCGRINPIIIDSEITFGLHDFDYKMILFDIYDRTNNKFLSRQEKEDIAKKLNLEIIPIQFVFTSISKLREAIDFIKASAEAQKIDGFVLKNGNEMIKVKPQTILESAYRLNSMLKGHIYLPDLLNYISKVVTADALKRPEEYNNIVEQIVEEARSDYSEEIVNNGYHEIQRRIAHYMAILTAEQIMQEKTFSSIGEMFTFLNLEIPKRFVPLNKYMNFELEKTTDDKDLRDKLKRKRTDIFSKVAKYCMKKIKNEMKVKL